MTELLTPKRITIPHMTRMHVNAGVHVKAGVHACESRGACMHGSSGAVEDPGGTLLWLYCLCLE